MAKKNRKNKNADANLPEGMSRRQAKLAARAAERAALERDPRPYDGFAAESDLIALQEFVPSASFTAETAPDAGFTRPVTICTVLPGAAAALVRAEEEGGEALVALQTQHRGDNPNRDLAFALNWAKTAEPGSTLEVAVSDGSIIDSDYEVLEEWAYRQPDNPVSEEQVKILVQQKVPGAPAS